MKKYITTLILAFIIFAANAQGNLQFNQVINEAYTVIPSSSYIIYTLGTLVVPAGKVLKIESASMTSITAQIYVASGNLSLGDQLIWGKAGSSNFIANIFPLWLSEGSYDIKYMPISSSSQTYSANFSAIEFNVVP